ncbi:hypothetical protein F5876DRAFT_67938 [Lentinula aff. lateritia]|uniref:Uncharacterized protein n=1 Tax=Lentinula aff. lateritia TaxID=2804960 RepID=A0ACC1TSR0_9AGAR|nr:hypothetical protein F5876DRAFT_67938 [Lentinula aff. lateritia]
MCEKNARVLGKDGVAKDLASKVIIMPAARKPLPEARDWLNSTVQPEPLKAILLKTTSVLGSALMIPHSDIAFHVLVVDLNFQNLRPVSQLGMLSRSKSLIRMYFNPVYLVLGLASAAYAMPFVATTTTTTTPTPTPQNPHPQLITRANSRSPLIAKIAFMGTHEGQTKQAEEYGIMPSKVYKRVKKAVKSLVPQENQNRDLILTFDVYFEGSVDEVFEICLTWNGQGPDVYGCVSFEDRRKGESGSWFIERATIISEFEQNIHT